MFESTICRFTPETVREPPCILSEPRTLSCEGRFSAPEEVRELLQEQI